MTKPGSERTILVIDGELNYIRNGWFFTEAFYYLPPYDDFIEKTQPEWKRFSCYSEYYIDGKWNRRTTACGMVR